MDIFSHGLWAAALAKIVNFKKKSPINVWLTAFWGIFPDVFAFAPMFFWLFYKYFTGGVEPSLFPKLGEMEPAVMDTSPIMRLTHLFYNSTHSLFAFGVIFLIMFLIFRRPRWSILGWLLHILIDIPSHSYKFFPTPAFWPISHWMFSGISWATPWFMVTNYLALAVIYIILFLKRKRN